MPRQQRPIPNSHHALYKFFKSKMPVCLLLFSGLCVAVPKVYGIPGNAEYGSTTTRPHGDWDYDGKRILGHIGFDLYLWDARTGKVLQKFIGHRSYIDSAQLSPDGKYVLSSSGVMQAGDFLPDCGPIDTNTRLWNVKTGKLIWKKEGQIAGKFSPDGKRLLTFALTRGCLDDAGISMWDVSSGRKLLDAESRKTSTGLGEVSAIYTRLAFSPDGHTFASNDSKMILYDAETGRQLGRVDRVDSFNFYGEHGEVATYSERGVEIWSRSAERIRQIPLNGKKGHQPAWTPDAKYMVEIRLGGAKKWRGAMRFWDVDDGTTISVDVNAFQFLPSPTESRGVLGDEGEAKSGHTAIKFTMYDMTTSKELWHAQEEAYDLLGFSPDGRTILVGGGPNFFVYDAATGEPVVTLNLLGTHVGDGYGGCRDAGGIQCEPPPRPAASLGHT